LISSTYQAFGKSFAWENEVEIRFSRRGSLCALLAAGRDCHGMPRDGAATHEKAGQVSLSGFCESRAPDCSGAD